MSRIGDAANAAATGVSNASGDLNQAAQQVGENLRELGGQVRDAAKEKYEQYSGQAREVYEQGRAVAQDWEQSLESYVQEKPMQALAIAAGVGLLLGLIWKRS